MLSHCYVIVEQVSCDAATGLSVIVGNRSYPCYHGGYVHQVAFLLGSGYLHKGAIECPACTEICPVRVKLV